MTLLPTDRSTKLLQHQTLAPFSFYQYLWRGRGLAIGNCSCLIFLLKKKNRRKTKIFSGRLSGVHVDIVGLFPCRLEKWTGATNGVIEALALAVTSLGHAHELRGPETPRGGGGGVKRNTGNGFCYQGQPHCSPATENSKNLQRIGDESVGSGA